uniref:Lon proteolytic domain-containing protein n=1 Tax=Globodera pallida TaxID=36090 RepID=A0A183CMK8_GLOPA
MHLKTLQNFTRRNLVFGFFDEMSLDKMSAPQCGVHQCSHVRVYPNGVSRGGPSDGVTVATAILSLALNIPTPDNLAMTGALDDQGHILPIGGVIEKVMAAKEAGKTRIVLPAGNQGQFGPFEETFADMEFVFVAHFDEVFELLFNN